MKRALVIGGADCVHADIAAALAIFTPDAIIAVNNIGMSYPRVDYWVSFHSEHFERWLKRRRELGLQDPKQLWSYRTWSQYPCSMPIQILRRRHWGGSSGLMATQVAIQELGFDRVVIAGCPLTNTPHFDREPGRVWKEAHRYHDQWRENAVDLKQYARSMSGWTREFLGYPTREWLGLDMTVSVGKL